VQASTCREKSPLSVVTLLQPACYHWAHRITTELDKDLYSEVVLRTANATGLPGTENSTHCDVDMLYLAANNVCSASNPAFSESTDLDHDDGETPRLTDKTG
jgi:hypothetical protein